MSLSVSLWVCEFVSEFCTYWDADASKKSLLIIFIEHETPVFDQLLWVFQSITLGETLKKYKQAVAELGKAQIKLGLDFTLFFCRFGFSRFGLAESVWWIKFCKFDWIDLVQFSIFGSLHFKHLAWYICLSRFCFVSLILSLFSTDYVW